MIKAEFANTTQSKPNRKRIALRYPYTGDSYCAESRDRIRVERAGRGELWGCFNGNGEWLEGPLRWADPTFCRYISSGWVLAARSERSES